MRQFTLLSYLPSPEKAEVIHLSAVSEVWNLKYRIVSNCSKICSSLNSAGFRIPVAPWGPRSGTARSWCSRLLLPVPAIRSEEQVPALGASDWTFMGKMTMKPHYFCRLGHYFCRLGHVLNFRDSEMSVRQVASTLHVS